MNKLSLNQLKTEKCPQKISVDEVSSTDIAIIGMSIKVSMADTIFKFWSNLENEIDSIEKCSDARKKDIIKYLQYTNQDPKNLDFLEMAYIEDIDKFDYNFFNIPPKEASLMDPHQRLFLETAYRALEDAGYGGNSLVGSRTGVYVGYSGEFFYKKYVNSIESSAYSLALPGNIPQIIASRIAYIFDFKGPCFLIDATCSSSLVAVHLACQGLRNQECDLAIAGGIRISLLPIHNMELLGIESSTSRAKTFDESADGTGAGEGVAAILLKPLHVALEDGDSIYAVIKGSAINQDGRSIGIVAPNPEAQADVIIRAWKDANINPETITYIEAHGTGTKLGDPIEIEGIKRAFNKYTDRKQFCAISSVKTNIGHLGSAAGIVGLIKAVLALHQKELPPTIHFNFPNRKINFEETPVYINDKHCKWEITDSIRRCGVSAFGLGGTNCHIVLEEIPKVETEEKITLELHVFTISAKSAEALNALINEYEESLNELIQYDLEDICYTSNTGRGHYDYRVALITNSKMDFVKKLKALQNPDNFNTEVEDIFFGIHRVVSTKTTFKNESDISESEKKVFDVKYETKLKEFIAADKKDKELLGDICKLYTKGAEPLWKELYEDRKYKKVRLPLYPFDRKRCWLEISEPQKEFPTRLTGKKDGKYTEMESIVATAWGEVLGIKEINIFSNFFELGADSIHAARVVNILNRTIGTKVEIDETLQYPGFIEFVKYLETKCDYQKSYNLYRIEKAAKKQYYTASSAQKRLFVLNKLDGINTSYNVSLILEIDGHLEKEFVEKAFNQLIIRHEALRTSFDIIDEEIVQIIRDNIELRIDYHELSGELYQKETEKNLITEFIQPFVLKKSPLLRVQLIKITNNRFILVCDLHHIIADGTSISILVHDFINLYFQAKLPDLKLQYKDFSEWQNKLLDSAEIKEQEQYWLNRFQGQIPVLNLPFDFPRPLKQSFKGDRIEFEIDRKSTLNLKKTATASEATLYMILLAVFNIFLSKYSGQEDIVVGSPIAGRPYEDLSNTVGMFINMLAMRNYPKGDKSFKQFLHEVKINAVQAYKNQDYQFERFVERLKIPRNSKHNPLFNVSFALQNMDITIPITQKEIRIIPQRNDSKTSKFDLTLYAVERQERIQCIFEFCTEIFTRETIEDFSKKIKTLIEIINGNTDIKIKDIVLFDSDEGDKSRLSSFINGIQNKTFNY